MLLKPDCIPCILKMTLDLLRKLPIGEDAVGGLFRRVLELPFLKGNDWQTTSPLVVETIMGIMSEAVGNPDPFAAIKEDQNRRVSVILPELRQWVRNAADPLETAVKLAIIGNAIDFMMAGGPSDLTDFIRGKLAAPMSVKYFALLQKRLAESRTLLYLCDNCGEVLLDKLLIETMRAGYPRLEVTVVVRSQPALNDVTEKEAREVGIDQVATIIQNGIGGPLPGTVLSRCSPRVRDLFHRSDLVIAKGGGNFDSLSESLEDLNTNLFFLLLSKCVPLMHFFNARMHDLLIWNATRL